MFFRAATLVSFAVAAHANFVLQVPISLGFNDVKETESPCGSFAATNRTGVSNYPVAGAPIQVLTNETSVTWDFKAALLQSPSTFLPLLPVVAQKGNGTFCLPHVPGNAAWTGQDAILQVVQHAASGTRYQCAAIKFVSGAAAGVPGSCVNSTGVTAAFDSTQASSSSQTSGATLSLAPRASSIASVAGATSGTPSSATTRPASSGSSVISSVKATSAATTGSVAKASTTATSKVNGTATTTPVKFTGAAVAARNVDVLVGGVAAMLALAL